MSPEHPRELQALSRATRPTPRTFGLVGVPIRLSLRSGGQIDAPKEAAQFVMRRAGMAGHAALNAF